MQWLTENLGTLLVGLALAGTVAAVIRDEKTGHKYAINDGNLCPNYAVLDPNLTVSLPPEQTAFTGTPAS